MYLGKIIVLVGLIVLSAGRSYAGFALGAKSMQSTVLGKQVDYSLIVPFAYLSDATATFPVLFALHGVGSNYEAFTGMQSVKGAVETHPMLVVAFNATDSYYADETDFLLGEFKDHIEATYRTNGQYAITGFSMGGYGAFHFMVDHPSQFVAVSAMSGAFYGDNTTLHPRLAALKAAGTSLPPIYMDCGTSDSWISNQREMKDTLTALGYSFEYHETAGSAHDYTFWEATMADIIPFHGNHFSSADLEDMWQNSSQRVEAVVSPNPSRGIFSIIGFTGNSVTISTMHGEVLGLVSVTQSVVNIGALVPALANGVYVISGDNGAVQARVMLVR